MNCENCGAELKPTVVHKMMGDSLYMLSAPGYECPHCFAIYDFEGTMIEKPIDQQDNTIDTGADAL